MTKREALKSIAQGHTLWNVEHAQEVCAAFDLTLPDHLIIRWQNQATANPTNDPKGIFLDDPDKAGEGVGSIELSNFVTNSLKLERSEYFGRGSQARANAQAVRQWLDIVEPE